MLMADAKMLHAEKMSSGELEYKAKIIESNDNGWKDEFVLILISIPMLLSFAVDSPCRAFQEYQRQREDRLRVQEPDLEQSLERMGLLSQILKMGFLRQT